MSNSCLPCGESIHCPFRVIGGRFLAQGTENIRNDTGEATITLARLPGSPGVTGTGGLITLTFQAVGINEEGVGIVQKGVLAD